MLLLNSLFWALILTIIIEVIVAYLLGLRKIREILVVVFLNVLTNPLLVYLTVLNDKFLFAQPKLLLVILELCVVFVEWGVLVYTIRRKSSFLFVVSFIMNVISFLFGVLIFGFV